MDQEIKTALEQVHTAWHEFKAKNDENLQKRDVLLDEQIKRINDAIDAAQKKADDAHKAATRKALFEKADEESLNKEIKSMLNSFCRIQDNQNRVSVDSFARKHFEQKDYQVQIDSDGGFLVMPQFLGIFEALIREISPIRQLANVQSTTSDRVELISYNKNTASGWVGETAARPKTTTADFQKIEIPVHEMYANPFATQKMLDDAGFDLGQWIIGEIADRFAEEEGEAFVLGDGVARPRGFLTYAATATAAYEYGKIRQVNSGGAAALTTNGLISLQGELKTAYRRNAVFVMNRTTIANVRKLTYAAGTAAYIWEPSFQVGTPQRILGNPVIEVPDMPDEAANALSAAYGDFGRCYQIADRLGMQILRDPYSNKPYVEFYATKRVSGGVKQFDAIKIQKCAS